MEAPLELQRLALDRLAQMAEACQRVAIVSLTSCNNNSCAAAQLEALEQVRRDVERPTGGGPTG